MSKQRALNTFLIFLKKPDVSILDNIVFVKATTSNMTIPSWNLNEIIECNLVEKFYPKDFSE
jgi:hypothetical protein